MHYPSLSYKHTPSLPHAAARRKSAVARSGQYIWRTQNDDKVRSSHAANSGRLFSWDSSPETGNPGEDYNCRCIAEAYVAGESEYANQVILPPISDSGSKWGNLDFLTYFYTGNGKGVTLAETGHLGGVIDYYFHDLKRYDAVNNQIIAEARKHDSGGFIYNFFNVYNFGSYLFAFGAGTVSGLFVGTVKKNGNRMSIEGYVHYYYFDIFTDILSLREFLFGSSTPDIIGGSELGGNSYTIMDVWITRFTAEVSASAGDSLYAL